MSRCSVITTGHLHTDHIAALEGLHGSVTIQRRCADLAELVAVARTSKAGAALVIGATEPLTRTLVSELRSVGLTVVAVSDVAEERRRLRGLAVAALHDDVGAQTLASALQGEPVDAQPPPQPDVHAPAEVPRADDLPNEVATVDSLLNDSPDEPADEHGGHAAGQGQVTGQGHAEQDGPGELEDRGGRDGLNDDDDELTDQGVGAADLSPQPMPGVIAVWGSHGSPGRTTLAVNLAAELAVAGRRVLLIDADTTASSAAAHLGLMEETAGLAQACRQADLGRLDAARLHRATTVVAVAGCRLHMLTGLPRADRWPELRASALRQLIQMVRGLYDHVLIDTAALLEQDEELTYDTQAPQRHAATLCALQEADRIIAVGAADPVGFARTVRAVEELRTQVPEAPEPELVINKVRSSAVGRSPQAQLCEAWRRFGHSPPISCFLPWEPEPCDAALLRGEVLAETAPQSPLRRAVADLAGTRLPERRRLLGRRRSGRRRPARTAQQVG